MWETWVRSLGWEDPLVGKIPWRRKWQPTLVVLPGESHGWRSLVGCSPWGHKESDTTDQLHFLYLVKEKEMTTHFSTLAWKIPWMEEPGRLQSIGSQRVGHDCPTSLSLSRENSSNSTNKACVISTTTSPTLFFMIKAKQGL